MMRFKTKSPNRYGTNNNNVNICINVNKFEQSSSSDTVEYLQDKVTSLTSDLNLLRNDVTQLTSIESFEEKLNQYFDLTEREKIKSLINDQSYNALNQYITKYEEFNSLITEGAKITYKETDIYLNESSSLSSTLIMAQIGTETIILNDITNPDNDEDTVYKIPIQGYVIGVEIYSSENLDSIRETFSGIKTSYNQNTKSSYVFLTYDDYQIVYDRRPNNKLKIHSLIIE